MGTRFFFRKAGELMAFRFYSNMLSQASKNFAAGMFITGLMLIGFGFLIFVLRDLFAILAAVIFFIAGIGCGVTAVKVLWGLHKMNKRNDVTGYRRNVDIRVEDEDI